MDATGVLADGGRRTHPVDQGDRAGGARGLERVHDAQRIAEAQHHLHHRVRDHQAPAHPDRPEAESAVAEDMPAQIRRGRADEQLVTGAESAYEVPGHGPIPRSADV
ncbi:hypothetical protein [Streptomyces sp. IMTB 2501]|uniref:hypothetical protein n=1 Tax=Streptomyces sp. IMTB 2501 TaxID=1776340 RepID=UPI002116D2B6|nr:hypothetical protein [Streptomyces sp. IMTB 2501]